MSDNTKIEWADATANYVNGCSIVSPGCINCYAMRSGARNLPNHPATGLTKPTKAGHVWTGEIRVVDKWLTTVLGWKRPRRIFWDAHGDLFHDAVSDEVIDRQFAVMALTPQHIHMVLTKRPERMREYLTRHRWHLWAAIGRAIDPARWAKLPLLIGGDCTPIPNVMLGTSVEDQQRADERIPALLATPAAVRFISAGPLLESIDLRRIPLPGLSPGMINALTGDINAYPMNGWTIDMREYPALDGVIVEGESGPGARPMHPDWARSLRDQCADAGVPFHFKQWGDHWPAELCPDQGDGQPWRYNPDGAASCLLHEIGLKRTDLKAVEYFRVGKKAAGRLLDGVQHDAMPGGAS